MRYCAILLGLAVLLVPRLLPAGDATIRETTLEIPTYPIGPDDRNPPLSNLNVYPYPMQTEIRRDKVPTMYRAVVLENDYLRVIILPDVGGRIYAAHDKTNEDFDFIYHNHVIKPGLVALRGAWISGGIEWNFPTRGHTVNTLSPVPYRVLKNADGSVTCVVGTLEWVRRMKWTVATTVYPNRSCFQNRIRLSNPTLTHNNGYFWANAAVHAWPDTKVTFSPADYTYAGRRRQPQPWPFHKGRDLGWYRNTERAFDYFCGVPADFVAAYHHDRDCGSVLFASRQQSFGKKFWTWGTARSGGIWEDILTDEDGPYIELQSGRLLTQGDSWLFEPHLQESWEETWYPIKNMDGFVKGNRDAAVNFRVQGGKLRVALNVTRFYRDATVRIMAGDDELSTESLSIKPGAGWRKEIALPANVESLRLEFLDHRNREIIRYEPNHSKSPPPELEPEMPTGPDASSEELYLAGYYAMKHWNLPRAVELFQQSLAKEPGFTPALRWLAAIHYKTGRFARALQLANQVLRRNEDDAMARYYRVLSRMALGNSERVEEDLVLLERRAAYRHVAPYLQSSLAVAEGDFGQAARHLQRAVRSNPQNTKARTMLACMLRHQGRVEEARRLLDEVHRIDPLNNVAAFETMRLGGASEDALALPRSDAQYYLEAACDYLQMNLLDDAATVLDGYESRDGTEPHPLIRLYQGFLADRSGERELAQRHFERSAELSPDYVFPFRAESVAALKTGLQYLPDNWKFHFWLGTLLTAKLQWQEGLEHFIAAAKDEPECAVLHRNLGETYWHRLADHEKAISAYERAFACQPGDASYFLALDQLYAMNEEHAKRDALFHKAPAAVQADTRVLLGRAAYFTDIGQYDQALEILDGHTFHPWEGWTGARQLFVRTLHLRADEAIARGKHAQATADLRRAMEWPENLGTGRPSRPDHSREHFKLGVCYKALGNLDRAQDHLLKATQSEGESRWAAEAKKELETLRQ